jgi:hypothetical protein
VYTQKQQEQLDEIAKEAASRFSPDSKAWWTSEGQLKDSVFSFGRACGFGVEKNGKSYRCSLAEHSENHKKRHQTLGKMISPSRKRERRTQRCVCGFIIIRFTTIASSHKTRFQPLFDDCPEKAVRVTSCVFDHSNSCLPSRQQLVNQKKAQGSYTRECLSKENLSKIVEFSRYGYLKPVALRKMLKELLPEGVPINAQVLCNICLKVDRIRRHMDEHPDSIQQPKEGPEDFMALAEDFLLNVRNNVSLDGTLNGVRQFYMLISIYAHHFLQIFQQNSLTMPVEIFVSYCVKLSTKETTPCTF